MGDVIDMHGQLAHLEDDELVENLARYADGTLSEAAVKSRHHLTNEDWAALGESDRLVELVEACKLRRIRSGATKRERAQIEIVDGPPILGKIMRDPNANERHRIRIRSRHSMRSPAPEPKPQRAGARKGLPELIDARVPWVMPLQRSRFTLRCRREVFIKPKQQEVSGWNEEQRQQRRDSKPRHHEHRHRLPQRAAGDSHRCKSKHRRCRCE